ncbi:MAG: transaldolase family protein, partial [Acutalibacteraceae bacterium]|nr:transaldolase family protein [Acutalibacteraceae bacterium]
LDTADRKAIKHCNEFYPLWGVTTNPSIIAKEKEDFWTLLEDIREIIGPDKALFVQTVQKTSDKIVAEVLGQDITVVNGQAAGAVGACMLAGIGIGTYKDEKDAFNKTNFPKVTYSCK